jgi:hypothetical protein
LPGVTAALLACAVLHISGCGGGSGGGSGPIEAVEIVVQPLSQIVPIGQAATFNVSAVGLPGPSYQWSENGVEIAGATGASYTTPAVVLGENGSTSIGSYQVTVSNANSTVTSSAVTLAAGPRSPKAGDLRYLLFEQVDVPGMDSYGAGNLGDATAVVNNGIGTPLTLGSTEMVAGGCGWHFSYDFLPPPMTGLAMHYELDETWSTNTPYTSYLQSIAAPNVVLTSMDLEPSCGVFGVSWVQTTQAGGFDQRLETVPFGQALQAGIQSQATQDGAESRVITAVTFDNQAGLADLISYGWAADTTTVYESRTQVVQPGNVASTATALASEGYFVSAFGGNDTDGYILVGTRVKGDSLSRPILVSTDAGDIPASNPDSAYTTPVLLLNEPSSGLLLVQEQ